MSASERTFTIVDDTGYLAQPGESLLYWNRPTELRSGHYSLPDKADELSLTIRDEYLAWTYQMGLHPINQSTLSEHLRVGSAPSFWRTSLVHEKEPLKSPQIYDVFKLRALEILLDELGATNIHYRGHNRNVEIILSRWCRTTGRTYRKTRSGRKPSFRPSPLLLGFLYLALRLWRLARSHRPEAASPPRDSKEILLVTYFPNIDKEKAKQGEFQSLYWGRIPAELSQAGYFLRWVWIYAKHPEYSRREALEFCHRLNQKERGANYNLLDQFLTWSCLPKAIFAYLSLIARALHLRGIKTEFHLARSKIVFFELLRDDWVSSLFGKVAIENIFYNLAFEALSRSVQSSPLVVYLWENQPWEQALMHYWRERHNSSIFGFQHSTTPPLDLRHLSDRQDYVLSETQRDRIPDRLLVNGGFSWGLLQNTGFPVDKLKVVEALRYDSLMGRRKSRMRALKANGRTLLVLTGYDQSENRFQLNLLFSAQQLGLTSYDRIRIKPHPFCDVRSLISSDRGMELVYSPFRDLIETTDVVFCSSTTSIAMEAAWLGLPIVLASPGRGMNLSPLFGNPEIEWAKSGAELHHLLKAPKPINIEDNYFKLDANLTEWKTLLELQAPSAPSSG
ncbi:MAG: hypothetical protein HYZ71_05430 [Deltaproteobacteria bacterium]|nr:hypothetical protein [Deltaproteobacteria bacterium]